MATCCFLMPQVVMMGSPRVRARTESGSTGTRSKGGATETDNNPFAAKRDLRRSVDLNGRQRGGDDGEGDDDDLEASGSVHARGDARGAAQLGA